MSNKIKIGVVTLGCDKNRVDSEKMLYSLVNGGFELTNDFNLADCLIVNTCAFIDSAKKEAIETILELAEFKKSGVCKALIVTGCLSQKYAGEIKDELKEVDAFLGVRDYDSILSIINKLVGADVVGATHCRPQIVKTDGAGNENTKRILTTPQHYAYLKIADGCNNCCSYCTIPSIRGKYISRPLQDLIGETQDLIKAGVKELIVVAQDVTRYGQDIDSGYKLVDLLKELVKTDIEKIRLMYCYPELVTDELLDFVANDDKMVKYLDIPFQHINDRILKLMNRNSNSGTILNLVKRIRNLNKYIAVRSTFIVGFPGETEGEFDELCNFVKAAKLDHVGIFEYSKQDGTPAALLKGQISDAVKQKRHKTLAKIQYENVIEFNKSMVGKTVKVTYEGIDYDKNLFYGRSQFSAPDIDTLVYFTADFVDIGCDYDVLITGYDGYDLAGQLTTYN